MPFLDAGWEVFAFEPDPDNRAKLLQRLSEKKSQGSVVVDSRAASDQSQDGLPFFASPESRGVSGLSAFLESHDVRTHVSTVTLAEALNEYRVTEVDFLKIDTEGFDLFVLKGFPWGRCRARVIECEFEDHKTIPLGYSFRDLANFLVGHGYHVYVSEWHPVVRYGVKHDWNGLRRYPCTLRNGTGWGNLSAFQEDLGEARLREAFGRRLKLTPQKAVP